MELNIKDLAIPEKILDLGKIKIHLKGLDTIQEQYIEVIKYHRFTQIEDIDRAGTEYMRRLVSCMVKKVEGVTVNKKPWDVSFIDGKKSEITKESYNVLVKIMDKVPEKKIIDLIQDFYKEQRQAQIDGIEFEVDSEETDKKKD